MAQMIKGEGNYLTDEDGNRWLDMQSGILNTPLGHGSHAVSCALLEVKHGGLINTYDRTSMNTEKVTAELAIYDEQYTWKLFNTGGEAVDKAIQVVATILGKMPTVAVMPNAFHGKLLSMSYANFGNKLPWGNPLKLVVLDDLNNPPDFDALIYEPVRGHDGFIADQDALAALCRAKIAFMIADEMITGFLRCGKRFLSSGLSDIIISGKGISGGAPLSVLGMRHGIFAALPQGNIPVGWRSTGVGNNLCTTIANKILVDLRISEANYQHTVDVLQERLSVLGFMAKGAIGFKQLKNFDMTRKIFEEERVIASWHNAPLLRVAPSFVTTEEQLDRLTAVLHKAGEL